MRLLFIFVLLSLLPVNAYCEKNKLFVDELHESAGISIIKHFVDDVLSLLPDDFKKHLDADTIRKAVNFNTSGSQLLKYEIMPEKDLTNMYVKLSKRYSDNKIDDITLSDELGNTVAAIIETSMVSGSYDPIGEKLKYNLNRFLNEEYKKTHVIEYEGYSKKDINTCVSKIYELSKHNKNNIYPQIVMRTADLWASVHYANKETVSSTKKSFIRQPSNIAYTGRHNSSYGDSRSNSGSGQAHNESAQSRNSAANKSNADNDSSNEPAFIILVPIR